jgi:hypothetical protein
MAELEISREQSKAVVSWIADRKGKRLSDDAIGTNCFVLEGEPIILSTSAKNTISEKGELSVNRTTKLVAGQQVLASLEVAGVIQIPKPGQA